MAYFDRIVPIPEGKIAKSKGYVYLTLESVYFPEKKYNSHKRVLIGKVVNDTEMNPNDKYYIHFPDEQPDEDFEDVPTMADAVEVGAVAITHHLYEDLGLRDVLYEVFPESATRIEDLATYFCLSGSSVIQHYPKWRFKHPGNDDTNVSDSTISRFFNTEISPVKIEEFLKLWNKDRDRNQKIYFNFDSTNMGCEAEGVELAEFGYAKDDSTIPQVNVSIATSSVNGLPLLYDVYPGSIIDVSEFHDFLAKVERFGYSNVGLILDRGYLSKKNMSEIREANYDFLIMLKDNNKAVREAISKYGPILNEGYKYLIKHHDGVLFGMTVKNKLFVSDTEEVYFHIFYDCDREARAKKDLALLLELFEYELKKSIQDADMDENRAKKYARYFDLEMKDGVVIGYDMNLENIRNELMMRSCFVIASTEEMSAEQAIEAYRDRDEIEKLFSSIKRGMDGAKFRVHSDQSLIAKVFIFFIAAILRSQIYFALKQLKIQEKNKKDFTVPAALAEMSNIQAILRSDGQYERRRVLTKTQKKILSAFNMTEKDIDLLIREI